VGEGGEPTGAGSSRGAGRNMRDTVSVAASLAGKYLTAVSEDAQKVAIEVGEEDVNRAAALLENMTKAAAEEKKER
jgi:hypothetical protein